jgi:hypothetical protein
MLTSNPLYRNEKIGKKSKHNDNMRFQDNRATAFVKDRKAACVSIASNDAAALVTLVIALPKEPFPFSDVEVPEKTISGQLIQPYQVPETNLLLIKDLKQKIKSSGVSTDFNDTNRVYVYFYISKKFRPSGKYFNMNCSDDVLLFSEEAFRN